MYLIFAVSTLLLIEISSMHLIFNDNLTLAICPTQSNPLKFKLDWFIVLANRIKATSLFDWPPYEVRVYPPLGPNQSIIVVFKQLNYALKSCQANPDAGVTR